MGTRPAAGPAPQQHAHTPHMLHWLPLKGTGGRRGSRGLADSRAETCKMRVGGGGGARGREPPGSPPCCSHMVGAGGPLLAAACPPPQAPAPARARCCCWCCSACVQVICPDGESAVACNRDRYSNPNAAPRPTHLLGSNLQLQQLLRQQQRKQAEQQEARDAMMAEGDEEQEDGQQVCACALPRPTPRTTRAPCSGPGRGAPTLPALRWEPRPTKCSGRLAWLGALSLLWGPTLPRATHCATSLGPSATTHTTRPRKPPACRPFLCHLPPSSQPPTSTRSCAPTSSLTGSSGR